MEHGLKDIALYVQNTYKTLHSCHNFPAGSRQAARGACICETSLFKYRQTSYTSRTLVGNNIVDHPDVFGGSPIGAATITSSFST